MKWLSYYGGNFKFSVCQLDQTLELVQAEELKKLLSTVNRQGKVD
jgi:hypothetical protein